MVLFVDKLEKMELGGFTKDLRKAEYIFACHNKTFEDILSIVPETIQIPTGMFGSGKYVIVFNLDRNLLSVNLGIISSFIDLDKNFDIFADSLSPKSVAGFYKIQTQLKEKIKANEIDINQIQLSDDEQDFEIAYENYLKHTNRFKIT